MANTLRKLFIAIDVECDDNQVILSEQLEHSRTELAEKRKLTTFNQSFIKKSERPYLIDDGEIHAKRFEFYPLPGLIYSWQEIMYSRIVVGF